MVFEDDALNPSYLTPEMKAAAIAAKGVMVEDKWDEDQITAVEEEDPFEKVLYRKLLFCQVYFGSLPHFVCQDSRILARTISFSICYR